MKNGMLARIGLFQALAGMFGMGHAKDVSERRKNNGYGRIRHGGSRKTQGRSGTGKKISRAGFKLYKKMCRRPYSPAMVFGRKNRKYAKRGYGYVAPSQKKVKEAINA